ncbi:HXXEE domain-containing protein [Bacillus sp. DX1.1]|uniref:HXXEE domain-containing protein n=1 Tax=unclassified Bacillus (in: firmicutes) TaxID=185979 RepID=UPI00257121D1|nr:MULTISPECIES: HXXEE domain-containing protein [unclassified Bacillus (in: firmicutes)]MDM5153144.1 HXXEE domain-containing protein [Bacillus sp. DX1.1]WJE82113.1 HXXEE domain-containing protein [Bacillus sp. DX3.1]
MFKTPRSKNMATDIIIWCIPLFFLIHNLEEANQMPQYLANQFSINFISNHQFIIAICILTAIVLLFIILYQLQIISSIYWIIFIQGAIFLNAVQHIVLLLIYRSYNPGTISAFIIVLFSFYLFSLVKIQKRKLALTLFFSLLSYPIIIWITLFSASFFT